ncbi:hypothetical protein [Streptomyces sp. NPDC054837]
MKRFDCSAPSSRPPGSRRRLKADLDLMAEAKFTVIRVGESVWSTWEPENVTDALDGSAVPAGTPVRLGAWDVRVLRAVPESAEGDAREP